MKAFFDIFNKYTPSELEKNIFEGASDIKVYANREARTIDVNLRFDSLVEKEFLRKTENKLRETYNLSGMSIKPKYDRALFNGEYFSQIIIEAKRLTANVCFLKDCEVKTDIDEKNKIKIELAYGGKNYLEEPAKFVKLLQKIIADEFDFTADIELGGVTALYKNDEQDIKSTAKNIKAIEKDAKKTIKEEKAEKKERAAAEKQHTQQEKIEKIYAKTNKLSDDAGDGSAYDESTGVLRTGYLKIDFNIQDAVYNKSNKNAAEPVIPEDILPIGAIGGDVALSPDKFVVTCGKIFALETKDMRKTNSRSISLKLTDYHSSISVKLLDKEKPASELLAKISKNDCVIISGDAEFSDYDDEIILSLEYVVKTREVINTDTAEKKRVELHLHTTMSNMDSTIKPEEIIEYAYKTGHTAVAITDHGNVQAFPEAMLHKETLKLKDGESFKVIYGLEGYLLDDSDNSVFGKTNARFGEDEFVVFDVETTGLTPVSCGITEIGAVKIKAGEITDEFDTFVDPEMPIPAKITAMTGISDETVRGAPKIGQALGSFLDFAGGAMLVAHNAAFDIGFIKRYADKCRYSFNNPYLDTLQCPGI